MFPSHGELHAAVRERVAATPKSPCRARLTTEWSDCNGCHRIMAPTIHKLNTGEFGFLELVSGTGMLYLGGTPHTMFIKSKNQTFDLAWK